MLLPPQHTRTHTSAHAPNPQVGFSGGLVVDYPHSTRAKKCFLVLMVGTGGYIPQGKEGNPDDSDEEMAERGTVQVGFWNS